MDEHTVQTSGLDIVLDLSALPLWERVKCALGVLLGRRVKITHAQLNTRVVP